ncbi:MAG: exodeoxyribonuclease VII large subunit, partial [Proteobacteria bacterium]|nr:exodeoxyribonuclease VII large subunit [Pseudomonadota bacterium]
VLCRGGGSIEDLWAFNEEIVAEAIHHSALPVVTGIGHEVDFTIADFCADFRCPTPTGVAEKLVPDADKLRRHVRSLRDSLQLRLQRKIQFAEQQLTHCKKMLGDMRNVFNSLEFHLNLSKSHLLQAMGGYLLIKEQTFQTLTRRLHKENPTTRINLQKHYINLLVTQLKNHMQRTLERKGATLAEQATLLHSVSPLATLARGYAIVRKKQPGRVDWTVVSRASDARIGEELNVLLREGQLDCVVTRSK